MRQAAWLVGTMTVLVGCGAQPSGQAAASVTAAPSPAASATPAAAGTAAGFMVLLDGGGQGGSGPILLYDSRSNRTDQLAAQGSIPRFISATRISYVVSGAGGSRIVTMDLGSRKVETAATSDMPTIFDQSWNPSGTTVAYLAYKGSNLQSTFTIRSGGVDRTVVVLNRPAGGRGGSPDDEVKVQFSADGQYVVLVDTQAGPGPPGQGRFSVRRVDGSLAFGPADSYPPGPGGLTMATWSRGKDRLYFRDPSGVRAWDASNQAVTTLIPGLVWYWPSFSPDGRWIAYTSRDSRSVPHLQTYDLQTGQVVSLLPQLPRSHPVFVSPNTLWYEEEQPCPGSCEGATEPTGKILAYNIDTKAETALPFSGVYGVDVFWP